MRGLTPFRSRLSVTIFSDASWSIALPHQVYRSLENLEELGLGLAFVPIISPYKNIFMVLTALILGMAHYFMAKNKNTSKSTMIILWISTIISVGFITYSYLLER